jgi:hypothetical protein
VVSEIQRVGVCHSWSIVVKSIRGIALTLHQHINSGGGVVGRVGRAIYFLLFPTKEDSFGLATTDKL